MLNVMGKALTGELSCLMTGLVSLPVRKYRELLFSHWCQCGLWRHTFKFYIMLFMLRASHCPASYPVQGQVLLFSL